MDLCRRLLLNLIWAVEFSAPLMWKGKAFPPKSNLFSILFQVHDQWNENQGIWNIFRPQNRFTFPIGQRLWLNLILLSVLNLMMRSRSKVWIQFWRRKICVAMKAIFVMVLSFLAKFSNSVLRFRNYFFLYKELIHKSVCF